MKWLVYVGLIWRHVHGVDRHRFDADLDLTFQFEFDHDPDTRNRILPQVLHMLENQIYFMLLFTAVGVYLF